MHWIWSVVSGLTANRVEVKRAPKNPGTLYLTFDDGPHPENTPRLLDVLAAHQVRSTFFLVGENASAHPQLVRRLVDEGHALANHSTTHPKFRSLTPRQQLDEIDRTDAILGAVDGRARHAFRPPNGHATVTAIATCVWRRQPLVLWTFDSFDFKLHDTADLTARLERYRPQSGDILLFHDDMPATVRALDHMLPMWRSAGFQFEPL